MGTTTITTATATTEKAIEAKNMDGQQRHGKPEYIRSAIVTIKGKPREVDLAGIGRVRVDIIKWRGHKQVEIVVIEAKAD